MNQYYAEYQNWEDYKNGMYETTVNNKELLINNAVNLLSNIYDFDSACYEVVLKWKVSSAVNLTNKNCNRKAWLGQASCCLMFGIPEILTRLAWVRLTDKQRTSADRVAIKHITEYEKQWKQKLRELSVNTNNGTGLEYQMKLPLDWKI